jgi:peptidoglycan-N-acetylglucosamine deacetylase
MIIRFAKQTRIDTTSFTPAVYQGIADFMPSGACSAESRNFAAYADVMTFYSAPFWLRAFYPKGLVWEIPTRAKEIFLTFDDGPVPEVTPAVLQILDRYGIKATFFSVGDNVQKYPDLYNRLKKNGHATGNHTFHHLKAWKCNTGEYLSDTEKCQRLTGSSLFRPPHGQITRRLARELRKVYKIVMWTALSGDYNPKLSGEQVLENAVQNTRPGAIIVFHDSIKAQERLEYALPRYLEFCLKQGYRFSLIP